MRRDSIRLEERRFESAHIEKLEDYPAFHERHRVFPAVFEERNHRKILDVAGGMGVVGKRIQNYYDAQVICNDISPKCLKTMQHLGLTAVSFDIDDDDGVFPFSDNCFDAVIALATIEHVIHLDHFLTEIRRILQHDGFFYLSAPNYSGIPYLLPFLWTGKTFHDPLSEPSRYEFYAHVRYFTYRTLLEFVSSFGFHPDSVYLPLPESSSRYQELRAKSKSKALGFRYLMKGIYTILSPRWASEPIICFKNAPKGRVNKIRKVVL